MKNINFKEQVLPHLIAVIIFAMITVIFYNPLFFENKTLSQHDITQGIGGGQELREHRAETDEEALWTNSMFGGMPGYLINMRWDGNLVSYLEKIYTLGFGSSPAVTFTGFLSFYILLLVFGVRPYLAIAGALAYGLSSFHIISVAAGHIWKMRAISYMPLVLAGVHALYRNKTKKLYAVAILALAIALEIKSNHLQVTYYLLLMLVIYEINDLIYSIKNKEFKGLVKNRLYVLLAGLIAVGCNFGQLWATYEYGKYSTRGTSDLVAQEGSQRADDGLDKGYVFRWSSGKAESLMLMIPNIYGGSSTESLIADKDSNTMQALQRSNNPQAQQLARYASGYWGEQPGTSPIYAGAIVCFLFLLGMIVLDGRTKYWMLGGIVLSLMLSWGQNFTVFNDFMYNYFPLYNKFRAVTMVLVVALMLLPLVGFLALEKAFQSLWNKSFKKALIIALGGTAGLSLIFILIPSLFDFTKSIESQLPPWMLSAMIEDRKSLLQQDAFRTIAFILLMGGVLFLYLKGKISDLVGAAIVMILVLSDLWVVDKRYLNEDNYKRKTRNYGFSPSAADKKIDQDRGLHHRVLNLFGTWSEASTSYYHSSIGGYHGAKIKRYQELVDYCLDEQKNQVIGALQSGSSDFSTMTTLNMLNTRYIKFGEKAEQVLGNASAYGNAWMASSITKASNANEEIEGTCSIAIRGATVINTTEFPINSPENSNGVIQLTEYAPNKLVYEATVASDGIMIFSEIYYPKGWKAYINGEEAPIIRANYVLRALEVKAGQHDIVFEFKPSAYHVGNIVMMVASAGLILLLIGAGVIAWKDQDNG